jgi:serine/threonine-protein kinase
MALDPSELDHRVAELRAAGSLASAASLCAVHGEPARASRLFEEACRFADAAGQALRAGDAVRAMRLATLSGDEKLCRAMEQSLARDPERARLAAIDLAARGQHDRAGRLHQACGDLLAAGEAFEQAGTSGALDAARCFGEADRPADAARVLEAALREETGELAHELRLALGELYARHARHEAAVRALQRLSGEWRSRALPTLVASLEALGMSHALAEAQEEMRQLGVERRAPQARGEPTEVLFGRYQVLREVARTPHARLLEATDSVRGERVAVKLMAGQLAGAGRDALVRFAGEAEALERIRHRNIVPLREYRPDGPAMVLAWMEGGSLADLLAREAISPARAAEIARAVLAALAEAHRLGIVHRDVKPANVLFDGAGTAKLGDFGAAHLGGAQATMTAGEIGTIAYMAPEQRLGRKATTASDIFAVGAMLVEMITGALPDGVARVSDAHRDLDERHDALVARLIAEVPDDRFASAAEASDAIASLSWSSRAIPRAPRARPASVRPVPVDDERLSSLDGEPYPGASCFHDGWLDRDVVVVPLDEATRQRAAAYARAAHEALATVLRVELDARQIWIERPAGAPLLAQGRLLDEPRRRELREALESLHRVGGVHGSVDACHVFQSDDDVVLAFPIQPTIATAADDLLALSRL